MRKLVARHGGNVFFGLLFASIILLYTYNIIDTKALLAAFVSTVTMYYGYQKQKMESDILFKELFQAFNNKYDNDLNDLINTLATDAERKLMSEERNLIIDYLNLCAEEYLWWTKNRIPNDVWKAWNAGMITNLKIPQIRDVFDAETNTKNGQISYYGLYELLKTKI